MDRRSFLKASAAGAGGLALAGPLQAFMARTAMAAPPTSAGYGPLSPVTSLTDGVEYLALPPGFSYYSFGDVASIMSDGNPTPPAHDGMALFRAKAGKYRLVRNHESRTLGAPSIAPVDRSYDPLAAGGCTILEFDPKHPPATPLDVPSWVGIGGTYVNCAGGSTPWGSWLTCEETTSVNPANGVKHGYVFEVSAKTESGDPVTSVPLTGLGRFVHEAAIVDPHTCNVYLTEDSGTAGLFRFIPGAWGDLAKPGKLQMLKVGSSAYNAGTGQSVGAVLACSWVDIGDPDNTPYAQGLAQGGATFRRLEGAWYGDGYVYFNSTDGGDAQSGQVWAYCTYDATLTLLYESPSSTVLLKPDNLTVSPHGNVWLFEDPDRARQSFIKGLADDGTLFTFAANIRPGTIPGSSTPASWDEFAGGTFSPNGKWLFCNIQTPGVTLAITGPFKRVRR